MNCNESMRAVDELGRSPAAKWIGNRVDGKILRQKCTRCGAEKTLEMPAELLFAFKSGKRGDALASQVPDDFDAKLFAWKKAFQVAHEVCVESGPEAA